MCRKKGLILVLLGFVVLSVCPSLSFAAITTFNNPTTFANQGSIVENYGYDDFPTNAFTNPGDPWTTHGVTYTSGQNVIVGSGTFYSPISNVLCYDFWTPLTANIDVTSQYSMAGFDLGYLGANSLMSMDIYTNFNTYNISNLSVPLASSGLNFYGAIADGGEYFTGFRIASSGSVSAPAIDNVRLGYVQNAAVPEPATMSLLGLGLLGLLGFKKRKS